MQKMPKGAADLSDRLIEIAKEHVELKLKVKQFRKLGLKELADTLYRIRELQEEREAIKDQMRTGRA